MLTSMLKRSPQQLDGTTASNIQDEPQTPLILTPEMKPQDGLPAHTDNTTHENASETTPLLSKGPISPDSVSELDDIESQEPKRKSFVARHLESFRDGTALNDISTALNPKSWDNKAIWQRLAVEPARCLPAVIVGLLLNILDALSYGECKHGSISLAMGAHSSQA
jgi:sulfate permease, SulP family